MIRFWRKKVDTLQVEALLELQDLVNETKLLHKAIRANIVWPALGDWLQKQHDGCLLAADIHERDKDLDGAIFARQAAEIYNDVLREMKRLSLEYKV